MDVEARIFEKLDKIESRITDLCIRLSAMETEYNSHVESLQRRQDRKLKRRDYTLVVMALGLTTVEVLRTLGVI